MPQNLTWKGRCVCIGGGTSGFGLILAQQLAKQGADIAIVGRDESKLNHAIEILRNQAVGEIHGFSCDLGNPSDPRNATWKDWLGKQQLFAAIAAVGQSDRGFLSGLKADDLEQSLRTNVIASHYFSESCLSSLTRFHTVSNESAHLVHIASLAGIIAAPGLGAYSLSKHALVGMSRQMRIELKPKGIQVLLVACGPISTSRVPQNRYADLVNQRQLPESLNRPGGGSPVKAIPAERLANQVIKAIQDNRRELVVPWKAKLLCSLGALFPSLSDWYLTRTMQHPR